MKKPRSDSKLANLPDYQREQLAAWLLDEGLSYAHARVRLRLDCNVETSEAALGGFYQHFCAPLRLRQAAEAAKALPELAPGLMDGTDAAQAAVVQQAFFEVMSARERDPKAVLAFGALVGDLNRGRLERAKLEFNQRKHAETTALKTQDLALQREKFETDAAKLAMKFAAEIKTIAGNRSLDSDARVAQVRHRLFGVAPAVEVAP